MDTSDEPQPLPVEPAAAPLPPPAPRTEAQQRFELIEKNRAKNFEMAELLRDRLMHDFLALRQGTLRVERAVSSRGQVVHVEVEPGPQDLVALANAAKSVAEITYRALGDVESSDKSAKGGDSGGNSITVILPTVVHGGALEQKEARVSQVIDLRQRPEGTALEDVIPGPRVRVNDPNKPVLPSVWEEPAMDPTDL